MNNKKPDYQSTPVPPSMRKGLGETWLWAGGDRLDPLPEIIDKNGARDMTGTRRMREIEVLFGVRRA